MIANDSLQQRNLLMEHLYVAVKITAILAASADGTPFVPIVCGLY